MARTGTMILVDNTALCYNCVEMLWRQLTCEVQYGATAFWPRVKRMG